MSKLFFVNIPYNCSDRELQEWVESRGIETRSIRIVRDLVAGVSPAFGYVELKDDSRNRAWNGERHRASEPHAGGKHQRRESADRPKHKARN